MKIRKARIADLKEIDEIYQGGILYEERKKYPKKGKKEMFSRNFAVKHGDEAIRKLKKIP